MIIFVHGKQKRVKRPPTIDGMDVDEFIAQNADPIWLHQNEMWEYMDFPEDSGQAESNPEIPPQEWTSDADQLNGQEDDDIPF